MADEKMGGAARRAAAVSPGDAVRGAWKRNGYRSADYVRASGKSSSAVSQALASNLSCELASEMLAFGGYALVAVPAGAKLPDGSFVIGGRGVRDGR